MISQSLPCYSVMLSLARPCSGYFTYEVDNDNIISGHGHIVSILKGPSWELGFFLEGTREPWKGFEQERAMVRFGF